jgi:hypothetical protein
MKDQVEVLMNSNSQTIKLFEGGKYSKLLKIIILNFILYIIQVYCTLIYKQYESNEKM